MKLLFIIPILISGLCQGQGLTTGQTGGGSGSAAVYSPFVGTKYAANSWSSLAGFDTSGVSATIVGNKIQLAAGKPCG